MASAAIDLCRDDSDDEPMKRSSTVVARRPNQKRKNAQSIIDELPSLQRITLEAVAEAALRSSQEAVSAAEKVLSRKRKVMQHCLRCHEDFDPSTASCYSCTMEDHDEDNGMIESGTSGLSFLYPCCLKSDNSAEPCWVGSHVTKWSQFSTKMKDHWCDQVDDKHYWKDRELALQWQRKVRSASSACFECTYGDGYCTTCCTCGQAEDN